MSSLSPDSSSSSGCSGSVEDDVYDVVVVGGGVMGSATAAEVARRGLRCALLEQYNWGHVRGSSHGCSRILRRMYPATTYAQLMKEAYKLWEEAQSASGKSVFTRTGGVDIVGCASPIFTALTATARAEGTPVEVLTPEEVRARTGLLIPPHCVGLYQADTGYVRADEAVAMFQALAAARGCDMREWCGVERLDLSRPALCALTTSNGHTLLARKVVLCAGPWMAPLCERLLRVRLPLQVWQMHLLYCTAHDADGAERVKRLPVVIDYRTPALPTPRSGGTGVRVDESCVYSCPAPHLCGGVKFGLHFGLPTTPDERTFEPVKGIHCRPVQEWIRRHVPFLSPEPVAEESCLYTMSPDENFIIDTFPAPLNPSASTPAASSAPTPWHASPAAAATAEGEDRRVVVCGGFSGHGFKFAPLIGRIAAQLAAEGRTQYDVSLFALNRPALRTPS